MSILKLRIAEWTGALVCQIHFDGLLKLISLILQGFWEISIHQLFIDRLLQVHRQVKLSVLVSVFPQPIQYRSRKRNLQRFLKLPQLNVKLLWFPLIKHWIRQVQTGRALN